ncbi:hypothetical protein [Petrachloros mirabilis]
MPFTQENTTGYTDAELAELNAEWQQIIEREGLQPDSDEYYQREKQFQDEVARR